MHDIKKIRLMSLDTAMKLFNTKVLPIITYGLELIAEYLTKKQWADIENIKARYLKRVLGLSKYTASRLVYVMTKETFLLEEIRLQLAIQMTAQLKAAIDERKEKEKEIWEEFFTTDAVTNDDWKGPNFELRHLVTRLAVHGFHNKICSNNRYHDPSDNCVCSLCAKMCERYHILRCEKRKKTLTQYSKD